MTDEEAADTYRKVYKSIYPYLSNAVRRTFANVRHKQGPQRALKWLYSQEIAWGASDAGGRHTR